MKSTLYVSFGDFYCFPLSLGNKFEIIICVKLATF